MAIIVELSTKEDNPPSIDDVHRSQAKGTLDINGWRPWIVDKLGLGLVWGFKPAGLARGGESLLV